MHDFPYLVRLLRRHEVTAVADVRSVPVHRSDAAPARVEDVVPRDLVDNAVLPRSEDEPHLVERRGDVAVEHPT